LLRQPIDWELLLRLADRHGVRALLYWQLQEMGRETVPPDVWQGLQDHFLWNTQHKMLLAGELLALLKLFQGHGINTVPYKGPTLTAAVYDNLGQREFGDLDILVPPEDVLRVKDLLMAHGYRPETEYSPGQEVVLLRSQNEYGFRHNDYNFLVEIHWRLLPRYFTCEFNLGLWRERLVSVTLLNQSVPTFAPEDLLLFLCAHGAKHCWASLGWICDIAEILRVHQNLHWDALIRQAQTLGCERILYLGLHLAHALLGATLPDEAAEAVRSDSALPALTRQVTQQLADERKRASTDVNTESLVFVLRARERRRDQLEYCLRLLMIPTNARQGGLLSLPAPFFLLHYLWRPLWLARRIGGYLLSWGRSKAG
jgi:hypothetical protein